MTQPKPLKWNKVRKRLTMSTDGRYAIIKTPLPEIGDRPRVTYTLRHIDEGMARAYPGNLGYFVDEYYNRKQAKRAAETHQYCLANHAARSIPEDYPAEAMTRFFWPISEGITRGALVVERDEDGTLYARVLGTSRGEADENGESKFAPVTFAEISLADLPASR